MHTFLPLIVILQSWIQTPPTTPLKSLSLSHNIHSTQEEKSCTFLEPLYIFDPSRSCSELSLSEKESIHTFLKNFFYTSHKNTDVEEFMPPMSSCIINRTFKNRKIRGVIIYSIPSLETKNTSSQWGYIHYLAVSPKYRRKGIGGTLINKVLDFSIKNNIFKLELHVEPDNKARSLYKKYGFKETWGQSRMFCNLKNK